jgi:hypothetical protein
VAEGALLYEIKEAVLQHAATILLGETAKRIFEEVPNAVLGFDSRSEKILRRELVLYGLIDIAREDRSSYATTAGLMSPSGTVTRTVTIWKLTDYGRRQLAAIAP